MRSALAARRLVVTAVIAAVVAMNVVLGRSTGAAADLAQLRSLPAELEASAARNASLYDQTGRLLVRLAEAEAIAPAVRSGAVTAIRTIIRSSFRVSERCRQLSDAIDSLPMGIPGTAAQLSEALSGYRAAGHDLEINLDELERRLDATTTTTNIVTIELEAFSDSAEAYDRSARTFDAALGNLEGILVGQIRSPGDVRLSVYGFFDDRKTSPNDYGLYTHVLFASESDRNVVLLTAILQNPTEDLFPEQRAAINLFVIPVLSSIKAEIFARTAASAPDDIAGPGVYNYDRARKILGQICFGPNSDIPDLCSGDWQGPFLLTHREYLSGASVVAPPYLLVDLSNISDAAFAEFVHAVKQQVMLPDFTSREKIVTFRLQLLEVTLKAADWLGGPLPQGIGEILAMVKG
jgi:hypothetical protein